MQLNDNPFQIYKNEKKCNDFLIVFRSYQNFSNPRSDIVIIIETSSDDNKCF